MHKIVKIGEYPEWAKTYLIKKAINDTHKALELELTEMATDLGFQKHHQFIANPDIALENNSKAVFVGDAKDCENETPNTTATRDRIMGYIIEFTLKLQAKEINGGIIAIATDDLETAKEWKKFLDWAATVCKLHAGDGTTPDFQIKHPEHGKKGFVVWW